MDKTQTMFRTIINGQSAMKSELLTKIESVHKEVQELRKQTDGGFKRVEKRIDKIGLQVASLEDDAPTYEEFDNLKERVVKAEQKITTN